LLVNNFKKAKDKYKQAMESAAKEVGITGTAAIQAIAPVDTGTLRRSYGYRVEGQDKTYVVYFGTNVDYAIYVEMKPESRGGRPHLRRAIQSETNEFKDIVAKHLSSLG
jgi:hypothetical protein